MHDLRMKELLTKTLLDLNKHYNKTKFSPFACAGKLKKFTVPVELIYDTMQVLNSKRPEPSRCWGFCYKTLDNLKIDQNILQSLQESNGYKKDIELGASKLFGDMQEFFRSRQ